LLQPRKLEVLCACDERYLPHAATMLCSLLKHNDVSRIHLFHSSIAYPELAKLKSLVAAYKSDITLYEVTPTELQDLRVDKWASPAVYYRLLAPRILPSNVDKILYLDSDIIVRRSLSDLWNIDLADHALAAVPNYEDDARKALGLPAGTKYFNSGVLLINLQFWRLNDVAERAVSFAKNNPERVRYWDQDALNATLTGQWIELPPYWNAQMDRNRKFKLDIAMDPAIVHFVTDDKPWKWSNRHPFKDEYRKYRLETPWRRYRQEGTPRLPRRLYLLLWSFARAMLPASFRQWLRSDLMNIKRALALFSPHIWKRRSELKFWKRMYVERDGHLPNSHYEPLYTSVYGLQRKDYEAKRVLDIGCGPCGSLEWANMAAQRVGLDPLVPEYLNLGATKHKMEYVASRSENIPFPDGYFDIVTCLNALDHVDDLEVTIQEIKRVTKRHGLFLLSVEIDHPPSETEPITIDDAALKKFGPEFDVVAQFRVGTPSDHDLHRAVVTRSPVYIAGQPGIYVARYLRK
jgi:lipopolysaccharide biosynthesis glycosyltransferase